MTLDEEYAQLEKDIREAFDELRDSKGTDRGYYTLSPAIQNLFAMQEHRYNLKRLLAIARGEQDEIPDA